MKDLPCLVYGFSSIRGYKLVVDSPDKSIKSKARDADLITAPLAAALQAAKEKVVIVSAYFVPLKSGVEFLTALEERGVDVTIVTNSLAANNQFTVHAGYAPARKPLLEAGAKIHEMQADADIADTEFIDASDARATLHTKAFIVDDESFFIGSFNFDPRSANINTELGVVIHDPDLAMTYSKLFTEALPVKTYDVFLDDNGKLRWRGYVNGEEVVFDKEPDTTWGQRFKVGLARLIPKGRL